MEKTTERSVERTFNIIEELALWPYGVTLTELSTCVSLPKATTHRLLNTLISRGYVTREVNSGKYRLTMRLFEISSYGSDGRQILFVALPYLESLARVSNETIHLAVPDGAEMVYLFRGESRNMGVRMPGGVGIRTPLYACSTGKSIMAALPVEERKALWKKMKFNKKTVNSKTCFEEFEPEVEQILQRGYAIDNEEGDIGVRGIAVSIRNYIGRPIASIGISSLVRYMGDDKIEELAPKLITVAQEIASAINT